MSDIELQRVLREVLEQQTATSEILRVISRSPTDVQPVFDAIVRSAQALTAAATSAVFIVARDQITVAAAVAAGDGVSSHDIAAWRAQYPRVPTPDTVMGRAILERQAVQAKDLETDPQFSAARRAASSAFGPSSGCPCSATDTPSAPSRCGAGK